MLRSGHTLNSRSGSHVGLSDLLHPVAPGRWIVTTKHDGENHDRSTFNPVVNNVRESVQANRPHTIRINGSLLGTLLDTIECRFTLL